MRFMLHSPVSFEPWCWKNSVETGIGGSETSAVEMGKWLARCGHEVTQYVNLPPDVPSGSVWENTVWRNIDEANFDDPGIWMLYRCPHVLDNFQAGRKDQVLWLCFQDWFYDTLTPARVAKLDRAVILCRAHERFLHQKCPELKHLTWITRNGIKNDLIAEVEAAGVPARNPKRIMFASSPDRGLKRALLIFQRAKEFVPDLEMFISYGFNNILKLIAAGGPTARKFQKDMDECMQLVEDTGAQFLGRIPQRQLYQEWLKTGLNIYATDFFETGWITGLESQALGAIPIFSPVFAQGENTRHGVPIDGPPDDWATLARFAYWVRSLAENPVMQDEIRKDMMPDVRSKWGWEQFSHLKPGENWVQAAEEDLAKKSAPTYSPPAPGFQLADNADEQESRAKWFKVEPDHVVIDVGCCDGSWAIPAAQAGAFVVAIDPMATRTEIGSQIEKTEGVQLSENGEQLPGYIMLLEGTATDHCGRDGTFTLDSVALQLDLKRVDFVKIDVEGEELRVLRGAGALLARFKPRLMVEVHEETVPGVSILPADVETILNELQVGYRTERRRLKYQGRVYWHLYAYVSQEATDGASE